jgi:hypothetical protein
MKMPRNNRATLSSALSTSADAGSVSCQEPDRCWIDLLVGTALPGGKKLDGRSVLVATTSQFAAIATTVELDGLARRIILYAPDLPLEHLPFVVDRAAVDLIISDRLTHPPNGLE